MKYTYKPQPSLAPTIITGSLKGLKLKVPDSARPFTGRVKQSVFDTLTNYLQQRMQGAKVLDLFAGSGNLGLEAISRGAGHATFVEINRKSVEIINENIRKARVDDSCTVVQRNVGDFLRECEEQFDIIFIDPPFELSESISLNLLPKVLKAAGVAVLKMPRRLNIKVPDQLILTTREEIGSNEIYYLLKPSQ